MIIISPSPLPSGPYHRFCFGVPSGLGKVLFDPGSPVFGKLLELVFITFETDFETDDATDFTVEFEGDQLTSAIIAIVYCIRPCGIKHEFIPT